MQLCPLDDSLLSIINNYSVLLSTWVEALEATAKAHIQGVCAQMKTFDFLFGTVLGEMVLRHIERKVNEYKCYSIHFSHEVFLFSQGITRKKAKVIEECRDVSDVGVVETLNIIVLTRMLFHVVHVMYSMFVKSCTAEI